MSHDLEDLISVIDGRASIVDEVRASAGAVRSFLRQEFTRLLADPGFLDALRGFVEPGRIAAARLVHLTKRLEELAS